MNPEDYTTLAPASVWIFRKYQELEKTLDDSLASYELTHSIDALYKFLWDSYADWYVEYLKTNNTQQVFSKELLKQYVITLSPYSPFETEALWAEYFKEEGLLAKVVKDEDWSKHVFESLNKDLSAGEEFENVIKFIENLRSLRGLFAIDPANFMEIYTTDQTLNKYQEFIKLVGRGEIVNVSRPEFYTVTSTKASYSVDIFKYIKDRQSEITRTQKIIQDLEKQVAALETQLNNPKFVENAEPEIIEEKKQNLVDRNVEMTQQKTKLDIL
jgi:valyl-tRNA synthetase